VLVLGRVHVAAHLIRSGPEFLFKAERGAVGGFRVLSCHRDEVRVADELLIVGRYLFGGFWPIQFP
jgi:hypothetical protein